MSDWEQHRPGDERPLRITSRRPPSEPSPKPSAFEEAMEGISQARRVGNMAAMNDGFVEALRILAAEMIELRERIDK